MEVFVPDGLPPARAFARITHLGIGAHPDDLEFMALHGIAACYDHATQWFGGVTCGDGAGSARAGEFADFSDEQMCHVRHEEQRRAAQIGRYGVMVQLGHPSAVLREPQGRDLQDDLAIVLGALRPGVVVYTHNLADKHPTHVAIALAAICAMRALPSDRRPLAVYGCEVWRGLDWMCDGEKIVHDLSGHETLADALAGVFASQNAGGKRYDLSVSARRRANATFLDPRNVDRFTAADFAMDLTPLVRDDALDIAGYVDGFIERFRNEVRGRLE